MTRGRGRGDAISDIHTLSGNKSVSVDMKVG